MSLADRTPENKSRGSRCSVGKLIDSIDPAEAEILEGWLDRSSGFEDKAIYRELKDEYNSDDPDVPDLITWGETPIGRHRRGDCKCDQ